MIIMISMMAKHPSPTDFQNEILMVCRFSHVSSLAAIIQERNNKLFRKNNWFSSTALRTLAGLGIHGGATATLEESDAEDEGDDEGPEEPVTTSLAGTQGRRGGLRGSHLLALFPVIFFLA